MIVERYPNPKDEVGGSIPGCEIVSLLERKTLRGGQVLPCVKKKLEIKSSMLKPH